MIKKILSIGALGGSGTRAIAQVLIQADIFMGNDLKMSVNQLDCCIESTIDVIANSKGIKIGS